MNDSQTTKPPVLLCAGVALLAFGGLIAQTTQPSSSPEMRIAAQPRVHVPVASPSHAVPQPLDREPHDQLKKDPFFYDENRDVRARKLIFHSEDLRHLPELWERVWGLEMPDVATPYRTHGGVLGESREAEQPRASSEGTDLMCCFVGYALKTALKSSPLSIMYWLEMQRRFRCGLVIPRMSFGANPPPPRELIFNEDWDQGLGDFERKRLDELLEPALRRELKDGVIK